MVPGTLNCWNDTSAISETNEKQSPLLMAKIKIRLKAQCKLGSVTFVFLKFIIPSLNSYHDYLAGYSDLNWDTATQFALNCNLGHLNLLEFALKS